MRARCLSLGFWGGNVCAPMQQVRVGLAGAGTVGGGVFQALQRNGALMASRLGVSFKVTQVAVKNARRKRAVDIPRAILTENWRQMVASPDVDVVCELVGGTENAKNIVLEALKAGKSVVTANKALLSAHGEELFSAAQN